MMKAELRIKSVGTKLTETEYGRLEAAARATGQTLAEWAREVLLAAVTETHATPAEETVLAEVLGLRTILLNLFYKLAKGEAITEEAGSAEFRIPETLRLLILLLSQNRGVRKQLRATFSLSHCLESLSCRSRKQAGRITGVEVRGL